MKKILRALLPQRVINYFYHLPKAIFANCIYGFPSWKLKVIGITGTDGKTTTTNMVYQILRDAGKRVSMVSTINAVVGGKSYDTGFHVTSPDPLMVQRLVKEAAENGDEYLILEVTSHAIDQFRFFGIKFLVGVITNITHEHLDYHKTFENYKNTKLKLIENVKIAVVNQNIENSITFSKASKFVTFGLSKGDFTNSKFKLNLKIPGGYNIENALAALAVSSVLGVDEDNAKKSLENFNNLVGRMEKVRNKKGINIYIDFAHTPNGLENALTTLKQAGKLIALIGCEGYRDVEKRELMGEVSAKLADITIITSVDPRGQLEVINKQIINGLEKAGAKKGQDYFVINDRVKAIRFAIKIAKKGDTIGIFGKGHETSMNLDGKKEISWSDKEAVEKALQNGRKS
jgi:UDP-N-acetylmuramoyl-L-alanyl-D-glutamate--2,6-diaminopimelate ligase